MHSLIHLLYVFYLAILFPDQGQYAGFEADAFIKYDALHADLAGNLGWIPPDTLHSPAREAQEKERQVAEAR